MDSKFQTPNASPYVSAPTSPTGCSLMQFYSAPTSPIGGGGSGSFGGGILETNEDVNSSLDDFEFETSRKFGSDFVFEASPKFEYLVDDEKPKKKQNGGVGNSFDSMAFADELFCDGQVLPLKLPPRLLYGNDTKCAGNSSIPASPRSPNSVIKIPFARRITWNDDFDPFMVALEKVREEKRGRNKGNDHRRTRSLSPFRTPTTFKWSIDSGGLNQHQNKQEGPLEPMHKQLESNPSDLIVSKGPTPQERPSKEEQAKDKGLSFRKREKTVKKGQEGPTMSISTSFPGPTLKKTGEGTVENGAGCIVETKMGKMKGILMRYASFGGERESSEGKETGDNAAMWKPSYFKKLSFKFKGNGKKKRASEESKMAVVKYKPTSYLCVGYGFEKS
ncbi:unnamed protein product [Ilex paraguariensis]|uniref:Uncharacterized protein n=1 Tax=Ilex paraguariensis TaxID=185542 RepID=A0ABC8TWF3_9AQUA